MYGRSKRILAVLMTAFISTIVGASIFLSFDLKTRRGSSLNCSALLKTIDIDMQHLQILSRVSRYTSACRRTSGRFSTYSGSPYSVSKRCCFPLHSSKAIYPIAMMRKCQAGQGGRPWISWSATLSCTFLCSYFFLSHDEDILLNAPTPASSLPTSQIR